MRSLKFFNIYLTVVALLFSCENQNLDKEKSEMERQSDLGKVIQLILEHPELQPYFHVDTLPNRKPLIILKNSLFSEEPSLHKFDIPVEFKTKEQIEQNNEPYLEFIKIDIGEKMAYLEFKYDVEGVYGKAQLSKDRKQWGIDDFSIFEE